MWTVLASVVADVLLHVFPWLGNRAGDRRRLREARVRCGIRAVRGRVLDIGTEWSVGTCDLAPGRLRFEPTLGIVGIREIEVLGLTVIGSDHQHSKVLGGGAVTTFRIETADGDLEWLVPARVADEAGSLVESSSPEPLAG